MNENSPNYPHRRWWFAAALVVVWLLWMTLRPQTQVTADLTPITAPATARGISVRLLIGIIGNMIVFTPLGLSVTLALKAPAWKTRLAWATASGALLSLCIEVLQLTIPSRVSAWDDWILNTMGTFMGAAVGCGMQKYREAKNAWKT